MNYLKFKKEQFINYFDSMAQNLYLSIIICDEYEEQCPEYKCAKWYHMLWFLIPIIGILLFTLNIKDNYKGKIK